MSSNTKNRTNDRSVKKPNSSSQRRKEADIISNKIMAAFIIAFMGTFGVMFLRNRVAAQGPTTMAGLKILAILGILAFLGGIVLYYRRNKQKDPSAYWFCFLAAAGIAAAMCSVLLYFVGYEISGFLSVLLPIIAIFYFLHTVFNRENFIVLTLCGVSAVLNWYTSIYLVPQSMTWKVLYIVFFLVLAAVFVVSICERSGKCALKFNKKELAILQPGGNHFLLFLTLAVLAAGVCVSFFLGSVAAYIFMFVSIAYLLVSIVFMMFKLF